MATLGGGGGAPPPGRRGGGGRKRKRGGGREDDEEERRRLNKIRKGKQPADEEDEGEGIDAVIRSTLEWAEAEEKRRMKALRKPRSVQQRMRERAKRRKAAEERLVEERRKAEIRKGKEPAAPNREVDERLKAKLREAMQRSRRLQEELHAIEQGPPVRARLPVEQRADRNRWLNNHRHVAHPALRPDPDEPSRGRRENDWMILASEQRMNLRVGGPREGILDARIVMNPWLARTAEDVQEFFRRDFTDPLLTLINSAIEGTDPTNVSREDLIQLFAGIERYAHMLNPGVIKEAVMTARMRRRDGLADRLEEIGRNLVHYGVGQMAGLLARFAQHTIGALEGDVATRNTPLADVPVVDPQTGNLRERQKVERLAEGSMDAIFDFVSDVVRQFAIAVGIFARMDDAHPPRVVDHLGVTTNQGLRNVQSDFVRDLTEGDITALRRLQDAVNADSTDAGGPADADFRPGNLRDGFDEFHRGQRRQFDTLREHFDPYMRVGFDLRRMYQEHGGAFGAVRSAVAHIPGAADAHDAPPQTRYHDLARGAHLEPHVARVANYMGERQRRVRAMAGQQMGRHIDALIPIVEAEVLALPSGAPGTQRMLEAALEIAEAEHTIEGRLLRGSGPNPLHEGTPGDSIMELPLEERVLTLRHLMRDAVDESAATIVPDIPSVPTLPNLDLQRRDAWDRPHAEQMDFLDHAFASQRRAWAGMNIAGEEEEEFEEPEPDVAEAAEASAAAEAMADVELLDSDGGEFPPDDEEDSAEAEFIANLADDF